MAIKDARLPEFDQEKATTRKALERLPVHKFDWKTYETFMPLGWCRCSSTIHLDGEPWRMPEFTTTAEVIERFDALAAVDQRGPCELTH